MAGQQAFSTKPVACLAGLLVLAALAGEATGVEFKNMGICLTECSNQVVQCSTPCIFKGLQAVQCVEACGVINLGCMGNCAGYKAVMMSELRRSPTTSSSNSPSMGMVLVKADLGS